METTRSLRLDRLVVLIALVMGLIASLALATPSPVRAAGEPFISVVVGESTGFPCTGTEFGFVGDCKIFL
ncbi:MAG: hypothetical protein O6951_03560, partial [Actinobacteria bacterium]|nr:hypothetical protein [Actinomycetota bacterium]